jgi:uroporphyrinogen-III synthase
MQNNEIKILSTKKLSEAQSDKINSFAQLVDFDILNVVSLNPVLKNIHQNIIFTSFKGAQEGLNLLSKEAKVHQFLCVGHKTFELLQKNNLTVLHSTNYSKELASWMVAEMPEASFTYMCSPDRLNDLPEILKKSKVSFEEIYCYNTEATNVTLYQRFHYDIYLWFSPKGVKAFQSSKLKMQNAKHICIGKTTAQEVINTFEIQDKDQVLYPEVPSVEGMITQIEKTMSIY